VDEKSAEGDPTFLACLSGVPTSPTSTKAKGIKIPSGLALNLHELFQPQVTLYLLFLLGHNQAG
jgi:hypothetical protein